MGGHSPFVGVEVWSLLFTWVNFIILLLIIKRFLWKPVMKILEKRRSEVENTYAAAEEAKTEAEIAKVQYEQKLSAAKEEASEIVKNAVNRAQLRSEQLLKEAKQQASTTIEKAEIEIEKERKKALNQVKDEISDLAVAIASKVIEREIKPEDHERLIEDFIENVGEAEWQKK